ARTLAEVRLRSVLAREESCAEREIGDHAEVLAHAERLQLTLEAVAIVQVVLWLQRLVVRQTVRLAGFERLRQARGRQVRGADGPDLPLSDELVVRAKRFLEGRVLVVPVRLVEVD